MPPLEAIDWRLRLRRHQLQPTRPRVATLDALHDQPNSTAEDVLRAVRRQLRRVSDQAVYDSLRTLTDAGLLICSHPAGTPPRWSLNDPTV